MLVYVAWLLPASIIRFSWAVHGARAPRRAIFILDHRHPVIMAEMLATIDALAHGRLIVGVGVGWWTDATDPRSFHIGNPGQIERNVQTPRRSAH